MGIKNLILHSYWRSSCSWRVRSVLEHKKLKYTILPANLKIGDQISEEFVKISPSAFVPVLSVENDDGSKFNISESLAIIDFLENAFPDTPSVYPTDLVARARVNEIVNIVVSGIQPLQNLLVIRYVTQLTKIPNINIDWPAYWINEKFKQLEKLLANVSGHYTVGDQFTLADICLLPQIHNAGRFNVDLTQFPTISRLKKTLDDERGPIYLARPDGQPDAHSDDS